MSRKSARHGAAWRGGSGNSLRFVSEKPHPTSRTYLPDCPAGHVRVAILTPDGALSQVKFGHVEEGVVTVRLFGERVTATPCAPVPGAPGARHSVTMPTEAEPE